MSKIKGFRPSVFVQSFVKCQPGAATGIKKIVIFRNYDSLSMININILIIHTNHNYFISITITFKKRRYFLWGIQRVRGTFESKYTYTYTQRHTYFIILLFFPDNTACAYYIKTRMK